MDVKTMKLRLERWLPIFEEQARSGMGKDEWCRANGIKRWEFYKRQRECRQYLFENAENNLDLPAVNLPEFFELPAEPKASEKEDIITVAKDIEPDGHIDISFGKFKIRLSGKVDASTLTTLIKAVADA